MLNLTLSKLKEWLQQVNLLSIHMQQYSSAVMYGGFFKINLSIFLFL